MKIDAVSIGKNPPHDVNVIIEIALGGDPIKYEMDKGSGALFVDRFLQTPMRYPCNYGFIPHTLSDDGDPMDALIVGNYPVIPGCVMRARPVGVLMMQDEAGQDEKLLMVPVEKITPLYRDISSYRNLPSNLIAQIEHFFAHYKDLEAGKWVKILGWKEADVASNLILEGIARAEKKG